MVQYAVVARLYCCWKVVLSIHQTREEAEKTREEAEKTFTRRWWSCFCFPCYAVKVYRARDLDENLKKTLRIF